MNDAKAKAYEWVADTIRARIEDPKGPLLLESVRLEVERIMAAHERAAKARSESP